MYVILKTNSASCGNSLSFYHTMWECPGAKQIRDSIFPQIPQDPIQLMKEVTLQSTSSSLPSNLKKTLHAYPGSPLHLELFKILFVIYNISTARANRH